MARALSPVVAVIPDMTRIHPHPLLGIMEMRNTKGFMKGEVALSPLLELAWIETFASCCLLFLHSVSKYLVRAFLLPGQLLSNEDGTVLRYLTVQSGNAGNKQITDYQW